MRILNYHKSRIAHSLAASLHVLLTRTLRVLRSPAEGFSLGGLIREFLFQLATILLLPFPIATRLWKDAVTVIGRG